jgi:hypothetical protein
LDKSGRRKVRRNIEDRFLEEARQNPDNLRKGGKNLTKSAKTAALAAAKDEFLSTMEDPISILDLKELEGATIKKTDLKRAVAKDFEGANLFIAGGKQLKTSDALATQFNLDPATGGPVGGAGPGVDTPAGALSQLEKDALGLITQGGALAGGDFSSQFAQDFLQSFNELQVGQRATRGEGALRGGQAQFERSFLGRLGARQAGSQMVKEGLGFLGVTSPLELPENQLRVLGQEFQQDLFQDIFDIQQESIQSGIDRSTDLGAIFEQTAVASAGAVVPQAVGGALGVGGAAGVTRLANIGA